MKPQTRSLYEPSVQRAIERIAGRLDEATDLHALAAEACLTPVTASEGDLQTALYVPLA